ncbi:ABC transporter ATP-binding protein [Desulfovibrio sp.]|uniref:ABC transporter ATP-binding protein n=1 Tax=Desulfovibrio sp. TaxID=885 RepID=UPI0025C324C9|nr:ABC transporter ATP-binding protein [Desulfovibrio sp.]
MLEAENISLVARSGKTILDGISFRLEPGRCMALIGPNGAGKSTLIRIVAGLDRPTSGRVLHQGQDLSSLNRRQRAQIVAYLPQVAHPVPCNVFDAVLLGRRSRMGWRPGKDDRLKTQAILEELNLAHMQKQCVTSLSGGELQKTLIARALAQEAPVLLLDEPVNHLDIRNQVDILETITKLAINRRMCVLIVLHHLSYALRYAQDAMLLHQGRSAYQGPTPALNEHDLSRVYGIPVRLQHIDGQPHVLF